MRVILECRGVEKRFAKHGAQVEVLRGVDLRIAEGESLAVLGHSGAGKSTLLHVLGTLEPPTKGELLYFGENVGKFSGRKLAQFRNRELGFVFQFHYLLPEFTALENVLMPSLIAGEDRAEWEPRAQKILESVGLGHRLQHRPAELSGGEQQRVALARAMVMGPKVLLADEPTGNLDSRNAAMVKELLFDINRNRGVTLVLVTHDEEMARDFSRQLEMKDGKILS
ncbi:MAG: ABC transporter ATP-binding protein [Bdellovibrionales bacterium]|nr:ABC transporter ATP-binding protein [Bdellovibrionales bacterium]